MKQQEIYNDQLIVITGAAGFIGSGVVRYLNEQGRTNLLLVDDFKETDKWKNLVGKQFVDIISRYDLFDFLKGRESEIEAFIHLGACSSTTERNADYLMENNYRYSVRLAEYAVENDHRFIYASSAATYGDGSDGFSDDHDRLEELKPLNMYGFSKHLFDLWLKREGLLNKVVGLKYFNVFGPNEGHKKEMASMVYKMVNKVETEGVVQLYKSNDPDRYSDGNQCRDFIYVKDAVRMTCQLLEDAFKGVSGIFNIGSGQPSTWNDLAKYLFSSLNKEPKIRYIDMPPPLFRQYQNYTCADMDKYTKQHKLQSSGTMSLKDAVFDYVQKHLVINSTW